MFALVTSISIFVSCVLAFIIGTIFGLFFGIKYRQINVKATTSKQNNITAGDNSAMSIQVPVYKEVELDDNTATIDFSPNIAYECTKKN